MQAGTWVFRPNGKPAIVTRVTENRGVWLYKDIVLSITVDVEWVTRAGYVRRATYDKTQLTEVPRA
jgi:hypothetical protein